MNFKVVLMTKKQNTNLYIFIWYHKVKNVTFVLKKPVIILILLSNSFQKVFTPEIKAKFFESLSQEMIFKGTNMYKFTVFYLRKLQILLKEKKLLFQKTYLKLQTAVSWNCADSITPKLTNTHIKKTKTIHMYRTSTHT